MAELDDDDKNPFSEKNVQPMILLTLLQIRDILGGILAQTNPEGYNQTRAEHNKGSLVLPPPFLVPQAEEKSETTDE